MRRPKPSLSNVIDFTAAAKRREVQTTVALEREGAIAFLPFSFAGSVKRRASQVEVVIDRFEGVGITMSTKDALALARALRSAARSGKKQHVG